MRGSRLCSILLQEEQASFLEDNLLSQLRAARVGQELNVWVQGRTKIRIRVGELPATFAMTNSYLLR